MATLTDPTQQPSLDRLIARLSQLVSAATDTLQADPSRVDDWYDELARQLRRYTLAAYMNGAKSTSAPPEAAQKLIADAVKSQLEYLSAFRDEIKASEEWQNAWNSRAQMYAESIKNTYWSGKTFGWPLPAMPGDGTTQCLTHCRCAWRIDELEGDGNADAYWVLSAVEHCQTCVERGSQWAPLKVRNGELL